jgi:hypothetical protein
MIGILRICICTRRIGRIVTLSSTRHRRGGLNNRREQKCISPSLNFNRNKFLDLSHPEKYISANRARRLYFEPQPSRGAKALLTIWIAAYVSKGVILAARVSHHLTAGVVKVRKQNVITTTRPKVKTTLTNLFSVGENVHRQQV